MNTVMAVPTSSKPAHDFDVCVYIPPDMFSMALNQLFSEEEVGTMAVYSTPNTYEPRAEKRQEQRTKKKNQIKQAHPCHLYLPCRGHGPLQSTTCIKAAMTVTPSATATPCTSRKHTEALTHTLFHQTRPDSSGRVHELPEESLSTHRLVRRLHIANWHASVWAEFCQ